MTKGSMINLILTGLTLSMAVFPWPAVAGASSTEKPDINTQIQDLLQGDWGQISLNLRYRFEHVEQDGLKTANGDPIRLRLGYLTPTFSGFQAFAEFEGNTSLFLDDFNDTTNGKTEYAVIADPDKGELNQAWLSFATIPDTLLKGGRQTILYDNQRFIGPVGWRQMEQTFDSISLLNTSLSNFSANIAYIWNVRTIVGKDVKMQSPLLNLTYTFPDLGSLTGYGYWLDYDDSDNSGPFQFAFSTQTIGLRFDGSTVVSDNLKLLYTAEYAGQKDYQSNPRDYAADYYHLVFGVLTPQSGSLITDISGKIAYEVLGSDNEVSFKTPLGTNHGFNGWADQFLTAPAEGLRDVYGILSGTVAGVKVDLVYHDFQADTGGDNYGTEFNAMLTKKIADHYTIQLAYANYNADELKTDTQKFWLQFTASF